MLPERQWATELIAFVLKQAASPQRRGLGYEVHPTLLARVSDFHACQINSMLKNSMMGRKKHERSCRRRWGRVCVCLGHVEKAEGVFWVLPFSARG